VSAFIRSGRLLGLSIFLFFPAFAMEILFQSCYRGPWLNFVKVEKAVAFRQYSPDFPQF